MIEFQNVSKTYSDQLALTNLNLRIESHELFVLVGPSGSGKTTLLKSVNGLVHPSSGKVMFDDIDITHAINIQNIRQKIGYVLQTGALFPNMTVAENARVQLDAQGIAKAESQNRVNELLAKVGLAPAKFNNKYPNELSGGEAQRVGIVRALVGQPNLVLMDEPFSALDPISKTQLQDLVLKLHAELHTTIIFVTHDMSEALKLADRLAVIQNGHLLQVGTPADITTRPANDLVRNLFAMQKIPSVSLQQVIASGFGSTPSSKAVSLNESSTIQDWARLLVKQPGYPIRVGKIGLTSSDLVKYLALSEGGQNSK